MLQIGTMVHSSCKVWKSSGQGLVSRGKTDDQVLEAEREGGSRLRE